MSALALLLTVVGLETVKSAIPLPNPTAFLGILLCFGGGFIARIAWERRK